MGNGREHFGSWFERRRLERGFSQEEVAEMTVLSLDTIIRIERGIVPWAFIEKMSEERKQIEELFGRYLDNKQAVDGDSLGLRNTESVDLGDDVLQGIGDGLRQQLEDLLEEIGGTGLDATSGSPSDKLDEATIGTHTGFEAYDNFCSRCGSPVLVTDDCCPNCGRAIDNSH